MGLIRNKIYEICPIKKNIIQFSMNPDDVGKHDSDEGVMQGQVR